MGRIHLAGGELVAPHLALVESANILRRLERSGKTTRFEATAALHELLRLDLDLMPFEPFAERVWELRGSVTSYDAWYIAIAEALHQPLATLDRRLSRGALSCYDEMLRRGPREDVRAWCLCWKGGLHQVPLW